VGEGSWLFRTGKALSSGNQQPKKPWVQLHQGEHFESRSKGMQTGAVAIKVKMTSSVTFLATALF